MAGTPLPEPAWIDDADRAFVKEVCEGFFECFEAGRELSQSDVAMVRQSGGRPRLFFKKSCVANLQKKSPRNPDSKWRVTQSSFINEHKFLQENAVIEQFNQNDVFILKPFRLHQSGEPTDFSTVFRTLTEYLDFDLTYCERKTMNFQIESPLVVRWLARFHAYFSGDTKAEVRNQFLENGGWWRKKLRPTVKWDNLVPTVRHLATQFPKEFQFLENNESAWSDLAAITSLAKSDSFLKQMGENQTIIHGDVKTCNFFLFRGKPGVIAIDFQWTGGAASGLGDIVYFFYGGVTTFEEDPSEESTCDFFERIRREEARLLRIYLDEYSRAKDTEGCLLSDDHAQLQYNLELLEYFSTAVPYLLSDLTPKVARKNFNKYGYLNYEFDPRMTAFFVARALEAFQATKHSLL